MACGSTSRGGHLPSRSTKRRQLCTAAILGAVLTLVAYLSLSNPAVRSAASATPQFPVASPAVFDPIFERYGECGNWQANYTQLHKDILSGARPPRYAVLTGVQTGLTDRLVGAISAFYYALLTDRAFQISTYGELPGFELVLDAPNIDWHHSPYNETDDLMVPMRVEYNSVVYHGAGGREFPASLDAAERERHEFIYNVNDGWPWRDIDLRREPSRNPDAEVVLIASNRGHTFPLFENPNHNEQLRAWGLTPQTAWQCAFGFLFRPKAGVAELFEKELRVLSDPEPLKIGVNIRVADVDETKVNGENTGKVFKTKEYDLDRAKASFDCAQQIENHTATNQTVVWYVMSDSIGLRMEAQKRWGSKVLTNPDMEVIHPDCYYFTTCYGNDTAKLVSMQQGLGQLLAFAMTDWQVVTRHSGFGRIGAILGSWRDHTYQIDGHFAADGTPRSCSKDEADSYAYVATSWAGL